MLLQSVLAESRACTLYWNIVRWRNFWPIPTGSAIRIWRNILVFHFAGSSICNFFIYGKNTREYIATFILVQLNIFPVKVPTRQEVWNLLVSTVTGQNTTRGEKEISFLRDSGAKLAHKFYVWLVSWMRFWTIKEFYAIIML